jgi:hypothetical protein
MYHAVEGKAAVVRLYAENIVFGERRLKWLGGAERSGGGGRNKPLGPMGIGRLK